MKMRRIISLRQLREAANLTLQEVGEQTGVALSTIQALETGRGKNYSVVLKHKVADFFHVNMFDLFPEERERVELILGKMRQKTITVSIQEFKKG